MLTIITRRKTTTGHAIAGDVAVLLLLDTGRPTMAVALSAALQLRKAVVSPWDRHRALLYLF